MSRGTRNKELLGILVAVLHCWSNAKCEYRISKFHFKLHLVPFLHQSRGESLFYLGADRWRLTRQLGEKYSVASKFPNICQLFVVNEHILTYNLSERYNSNSSSPVC